MKTRDKIIYSSLELFNEKGERAVTTNHIAAHLGISPGNLYYHFRNKEDIIQSIFQEYINFMTESFLPASDDVPPDIFLQRYCDEVFGSMWRFRFFHASMPDLVLRDDALHQKYLQAHSALAERAALAVTHLKRGGVIEIEDEQIGELVDLMRVVGSFWCNYAMANSMKPKLTKADVYDGVLKIMALLLPYATESGLTMLNDLRDKYDQLAHDQ